MVGFHSGPFVSAGEGPYITGIFIEWGDERTTATSRNESFDVATPGDTALTYRRADGELIDDHGWVTELDYFDGRDGSVNLCVQRWLLVDQWTITLPDPYPVDDDDDDADSGGD